MATETDIAIIGAGPFGLSLAAYLGHRKREFRIFGLPMHDWKSHMPKGMLLKSEGFASNLYDPRSEFTLGGFCAARGIPYADLGIPVPIEVFIDYGNAFQKKFAPNLEQKTVSAIRQVEFQFQLTFDDGTRATCRRVIVATGLGYFPHVPKELQGLPASLVTHSSDHNDPSLFGGRSVAVVGAGSSAIDLAALLSEGGARVDLLARRPAIDIHSQMALPRPIRDRITSPMSGIGPGWRALFYTDAPMLFQFLPDANRLRKVKNVAPPAAGWFMKSRMDKVNVRAGVRVVKAIPEEGRLKLDLVSTGETPSASSYDHVVAATGYKVDLGRMPFLDETIIPRIATVGGFPRLSSNFESSIPGLYFTGPPSAGTFGPVMRFAYGANYTARRVSRHLSR